MNWYVAKLVFNILNGNDQQSHQFDEQLRMIEAENLQAAFVKASKIGRLEESEMASDGYEQVKWKFIDVVELNEIQQLKDGVEIYSRVHEAEQSAEYIKFAHFKSRSIQNTTLVDSIAF